MRIRKRKKKISIRFELPKKPSRPIGTKKGKKGYDRKRAKREFKRELKDE